MAGERGRLVADALHQAAVAGDDVGVVVDQLGAEAGGQVALGQRHADRVGEALARAARSWSRCPSAWPCSGWPAVREPSWRKRCSSSSVMSGIAGEVEQRVEQHRAVAGREHEAVAVGPIRMLRVELQEPRPQHGGDVGHAHGHAGMAGLRLLDRIHGERADGVGEVGVADRHGQAASCPSGRAATAVSKSARNWTSSAENATRNSGRAPARRG